MKSSNSAERAKKSSSGTIVVESFKNRLRLRLRSNGKRLTVSLGICDSPENRRLAEGKAKELESELIFQRFDPENLKKYKFRLG